MFISFSLSPSLSPSLQKNKEKKKTPTTPKLSPPNASVLIANMLLLQNYSKELNFKFPRRENCNAIILKQTKLHFSYSLAVWKLWNPVSGRQPPFHLHIFKPAIPSPCTSHLAFVKKESAVSMLLRNSLGLLNKYFPIVAGCLTRYSSCISRSVTELHFLTQNELIVSGLVTWVGEHTAQSNKPLTDCCQGCAYDRGSEDEPSPAMVLLPPPALCHRSGRSHVRPQAAPAEEVPPGGLASAPCYCEGLEVGKHSASQRYQTNDF